MRRIFILFAALISSAWLWAQTPTAKTFSTISTMTTVDGNTWFVTLDGTPKVWKKFQGNTLRAFLHTNVTSITNATGLTGISGPYEGDLAINTAKDTLWIRGESGWIVFKAGTSGSTPTLQNVLVAGNSANSSRITNLGTPISGTDATTKNYVDTQVSAGVDAAGVYAAAVADLARDSAYARSIRTLRDSLARTGWVTSADLQNTAVTPGTYTNATVTFDADGRATSAANGSGGGSGGGIKNIFSNTQPSDTTVNWVDTGNGFAQAYPIRTYANGAWAPLNTELDYYDNVGKVISKGRPLTILASGQSNAFQSHYFPADANGYRGDTSNTNKRIVYWDNSALAWKVYRYGSLVYPYDNGQNQGVTSIDHFARLFSKRTGRSVRIVGTRVPGVGIVKWAQDSSAWTQLVTTANNSGIPQFDVFLWIHGEGEIGAGSAFTIYKDAFIDFITRLKAQSWGNPRLRVIAPSHGLGVSITTAGTASAEYAIRDLAADNDPYTNWARATDAREAQFGTSDQYHFTTREHERIGEAMYSAYLTSGNVKKEYPGSIVDTYTGNLVTTRIISNQNVNNLRILHQSGSSNGTGEHSYEFGNGNQSTFTSKIVGKGVNASGRVDLEFWLNGSGVNATVSDLAARFSSGGTYFAKPVQVLSNLGISTGAGNSGNAVLSFYADGSLSATATYGKALIAAAATGSFGQSDLHFVFSPSGGATPVVGTNTNVIFKQSGLNGFGTISPNSRVHIAGSFATQVTSLTASSELDATQHTILVSGASSAVNLTLPQAGFNIGREYIVICTNVTNAVNVIRRAASSDFICLPDGTTNATSVPFQRPYQTLKFKCTANNQWTLLDDVARLPGSATIDFPDTAAGAVSDANITVAGALDGDKVSLGIPNASQTATGRFFAWVSGTNTVTVRFSPGVLTGSENPASGTFKISVIK